MKIIKHLPSAAVVLALFVLAGAQALAASGDEDAAATADTASEPRLEGLCKLGFCMGEDVPNGTEREHALFDVGVLAMARDGIGVCRVTGGKVVRSPDDYGSAHREAYERITGLVRGKYGDPSGVFDYLNYDSIWDAPRDWLMGLRRGERTLAAAWSKRDGAVLPEGIDTIMVTTRPPVIIIQYDFSNIDECIAKAKAEESADL